MAGSPITARFGASVRSLRFRLAISQEELAERADMHRTYIAGIERGARNVTLKSIDKLARALGVSNADLLNPAGEFALQAGDPRSEASDGKFMDILVVEDSQADVELTLRAFEKAKITNPVHVVSDGAEALEFLFCRGRHAARKMENRPQLVLLDLNLPKIGGLEVLRRIKTDGRTRRIPVIVLTVSNRNRDIGECRRLGAETYIVKPVDFANFSKVTPQLSLRWALLEPAPAPSP
jgi:CheY-like chemotaxis protein/DNA-binding XRE family transcriptional regulator